MTTITTLSLLAASAGTALAMPAGMTGIHGPEKGVVRVVQTDPTRTDDIVVDTQNGPIAVYTTTPPSTTASSTYMVSQQDGDESYVIRIEDGKVVQLKHDGKDIDADHFQFDGDEIRILDDKGNVIKTHSLHVEMPDIPAIPDMPHIFRFGQGGNFVFDKNANAQFFTDAGGNQVTWDFQPKVMVGINQGVPGAALRYQLGLGEDQPCILIEKVIDGLPAAKAGLHQYDIVIKVDGKEADDKVLRDVLAEKEPGQSVTFKVIRQGKPAEIKVELEAYDSEKLMPQAFNAGPGGAFFSAPSGGTWVTTPDTPAAPGAAPTPNGLYHFTVPSPDVEAFTFRAEDFTDPAKAPEAIRRLREKIEQHADRVQLDGNRLMIAPDADRMRADAMKLADEAKKQAVQAADAAKGLYRSDIAPAAAERMDQLEKRLDELDRSLSDRLERLFDRLDSIAEQLKDTPADSDKDEI